VCLLVFFYLLLFYCYLLLCLVLVALAPSLFRYIDFSIYRYIGIKNRAKLIFLRPLRGIYSARGSSYCPDCQSVYIASMPCA